MSRIVKSISIPATELELVERAIDRVMHEADYPMVNHSMLFRMAVRALLEIKKDKLREIVWSVPELKSGPTRRS